jgi:energy-coupling factor transport system substrate-specific component
VSWQLASFSVLAIALAAGFAWYERSHPSARVLALVATMAALAALGRIAFAPLPNVKPTTDIVLISGAALGGAPGFAVGALAALTSNLFFGQGPWTPWQMAAWGGVGIAGALLQRVTRGHIGRVTLATACGIAGLAYGAVLNFSTWATYTGDHSLGAYTAIAGTALPFDIAHAAGNVAFALAFGPALLRALERFRRRFEVTWRPAAAIATPLAVLAALLLSSRRPGRRPRAATWSAPRTPTAGGARRPARAPRSCTPGGLPWAWPRTRETRATSTAAEHPDRLHARAGRPAGRHRRGGAHDPRARRRRGERLDTSPGATSSVSSSAAATGTAPTPAASCSRRSACSRSRRRGAPRRRVPAPR